MDDKKNWHDALSLFCADQEVRPAISKPFIVDDRTYCTDTFHAISLKCAYTGHYDAAENNRRIADIFTEIRDYMQTQANGKVNMQEIEAALPKHKTGKLQKKVVVKCKNCRGSGNTTCYHCDSEIECTDCDGTGGKAEWIDTDIPYFEDEGAYMMITIPGETEKSTNLAMGFLENLVKVWDIFGRPPVTLRLRNLKDPAFFTMTSQDGLEVEVIIMPVAVENTLENFFTA